MADVFNSSERSRIMRMVRSKFNKSTEIKLIKVFKSLKICGWLRNYNVKGHPDFVFLKKKIAVFVDGCFWHGHKHCKYSQLPKTNTDFWIQKIEQNQRNILFCFYI